MKYLFIEIPINLKGISVNLSGFYKRSNSEIIGRNELFIKIFWLKDSDDLIFISIDTLYIPKEISYEINSFMNNRFGLKIKNIIYNATHTHSSPAIEGKFDINSSDILINLISQSIQKELQIDKLIFKDCKLDFINKKVSKEVFISRRRISRDIRSFFIKKKMIMLPNKENKIDDDIRVIKVSNLGGRVELLIYNFSCHPVFNESNNISSDFVGEISYNLEKKTGLKSIFLQGFLGDIRPNFTTTSLLTAGLKDKLKILFNQEIFKTLDKKDFNYFTKTITNDLCNLLNEPISIKSSMCINTSLHSYVIKSAGIMTKNISVKFVKLSKILFVSIPAEVSSLYKVNLSEEFSGVDIIPLGLSDNIIGYLPFFTEIDEGGYEVYSAVNYGWDDSFSKKSIEDFYTNLKKDIRSFINE